jgi:hypothetical protein
MAYLREVREMMRNVAPAMLGMSAGLTAQTTLTGTAMLLRQAWQKPLDPAPGG